MEDVSRSLLICALKKIGYYEMCWFRKKGGLCWTWGVLVDWVYTQSRTTSPWAIFTCLWYNNTLLFERRCPAPIFFLFLMERGYFQVYQFPVHGPPVLQTQKVMVPCWSVPVPCSRSPSAADTESDGSPLLKCTSSLFMVPQCSRHRKWWFPPVEMYQFPVHGPPVQQTQKVMVPSVENPDLPKVLPLYNHAGWSVLVSHSWERGSLWSIPVEKGAHSEHCFPAPSTKMPKTVVVLFELV